MNEPGVILRVGKLPHCQNTEVDMRSICTVKGRGFAHRDTKLRVTATRRLNRENPTLQKINMPTP